MRRVRKHGPLFLAAWLWREVGGGGHGIVMAVEGLQAEGKELVGRHAVIWEEGRKNGSVF